MARAEKYLYLDHSVLAREKEWPDIEQFLSRTGMRLAASEWNLYEIANASDEAQRERRLAFLEKLRPIWMVERVDIQRQEMRRFLWRAHYNGDPPDLVVFSENLSVVDSFHAGGLVRIGLTARQWIAELNVEALNMRRALAPTALRTLQSADPKELKRLEEQVFRAWVRGLVPVTDPTGRANTLVQKKELLNFCWQNRDSFIVACPSLAVEDALLKPRTSDRRRNPSASDGPDLMHMAIALPYCDIFVVRDGYAFTCAKQASKALGSMKLAAVYERVGDIPMPAL